MSTMDCDLVCLNAGVLRVEVLFSWEASADALRRVFSC